jgi:hypothetical protein
MPNRFLNARTASIATAFLEARNQADEQHGFDATFAIAASASSSDTCAA